MLEKDDLIKIKEIVEDVVEKKLEEKLEQKLEEKLEQKLEQKLKPIHKKLNKLQKDMDLIARSTDKDLTRTMHRVTRIEKHLDLPPINFL